MLPPSMPSSPGLSGNFEDFLNHILLSVVALSESEPYGVRGGSLVVLFAPAPNSKDTPAKVTF